MMTAAGELASTSRGRKGSTPPASSSRPSSVRPQGPKRAHTSAISTASLRTLTKANAAAENVGLSTRAAKSPLLSPPVRAGPPFESAPKTPSPNYFGLEVDEDASNPPDSNAGKHAKRNWGTYSGGEDSSIPAEDDPQFELFRRQSEHATHFKLTQSTLARFSTDGRVPTLKTLREGGPLNGTVATGLTPPLSAGGRVQFHSAASDGDEMELEDTQRSDLADADARGEPSFFDLPRFESPQQGLPDRPEIRRNPLSTVDARHIQNSMPHTRVTTPHDAAGTRKPRAETLPSRPDIDAPQLLSASDLQAVLKVNDAESILLLDLRVSPQYSQARIRGALNLCIPTTLLKRPAFNIKKLADTFTSPDEKSKFINWQRFAAIVVYDASSIQLKDAQSGVNTLKKFRDEGFKGSCHILKGGFNAVLNSQPELIERSAGSANAAGGLNLTLGSKAAGQAAQTVQVAGGCPMPEASEQPANPFFGNIRQNMDLVDGVGQMPIKRPALLDGANIRALPAWLRDVVDDEGGEGKLVSQRFLAIEKAEQKRLQSAYSTKVSYGASATRNPSVGRAEETGRAQIAGIEKGVKNRYKDMLPYEHARVHLEQADDDGCDYINASHVKAQWSNRRYIATQAPVPATFKDFWRLIWEQDVRVIVVLTAQTENGQRKCHPYWEADTYGSFKVKLLSEKRLSLERPSRASLLDPNRKVSMPLSALLASKEHPSRVQRRATLMGEGDIGVGAQVNGSGPESSKEPPFCVIRKLALSDVRQPFAPLREVAQIEYTNWPDFGAPAEAGELLTLVEQVDAIIRASNSAGRGRRDGESLTSPVFPNGLAHIEDDESKWPVPGRERPVVVHCSAGCGRTGTFVTVDSVVDMLKRQRLVASRHRSSSRNRSGLNVRLQTGPESNGSREPNPFETAATSFNLSSPTDSIVSPTSRMELDSPKRKGQSSRDGRFGSLDVDIRGNKGGSDEDEVSDSEDEGPGRGDEDLDSQDWVKREDIDLVQKAVEDFRLQRLSMVQNLRQFTLCYESVLEWIVREMPERFRREHFRKSYQG